jgi:hypothetical protein
MWKIGKQMVCANLRQPTFPACIFEYVLIVHISR